MAEITVAASQVDSGKNKEENISNALSFVDKAAERGVDLVAFPEMLSFMGKESNYTAIAEPIPGPITQQLSEKAIEHGMYVHAGSILETIEHEDRVYNTSVLIDDTGDIIAKYKKTHLFDIEIDGEVEYQESANVAPGDQIVTAETDLTTFGLSICYDLRFPEYYRALTRAGAKVIFVPAAFTLQTGKDHWQPLLRARAIENQVYVIAPGQIGDKEDSLHTYGKSMVIDPWGNVISQASDREEIITASIDLDYLDEVRTNLPCLDHSRPELY